MVFNAMLCTHSAQGGCVRYCAQKLSVQCTGGIGGASVSDTGQVTGTFYCIPAFSYDAFLWTGDAVITLPPLPGYPDAHGWDVNSSGTVVGQVQDANGTHYFALVYSDGVTTNLGTLPGGNHSIALGINERGTVCGEWGNDSTGNPAIHGFVWDGAFLDLNLPIGPNNIANDINGAGSVCGWMGQVEHVNSVAYIRHPDGGVVDLGKPPGANAAQAIALNDLDDACGGCRFPPDGDPPPNIKPYLWIRGNAIALTLIPGCTRGEALDINNEGVVVGRCWKGNAFHGFVWRDGAMTDLNDLLEPGSGLDIDSANGINDAGQITGSGIDANGEGVAFLLTPVPPIAADLTCDWAVGADDLAVLLGDWGACPPSGRGGVAPRCRADLNGDGAVDAADLAILLGSWTR